MFKGFFLAVLLAFVASSSFSRASEYHPEVMPKRDVVLEQFKKRFGKSIDTFFEERDANKNLDDCRKKLAKKEDAYRKIFATAREKTDYAALEDLLLGSVLEGEAGLVDLMNKCGRCRVEVKAIGFKSYEADGWCKAKPGDEEALRRSYDAAVKRLTNLDSYPKRNKGFIYMMEFKGVDPNSGKPSTSSASPFLAYISVKGMFNVAFGYLARIFHQELKDDVSKNPYFVMQFNRADSPVGWVRGEVYNFPPEDPLTIWELQDVFGQWYADMEGNFRYFTKADFNGFAVPGQEDLATRVATDTVWTFYDGIRPKELR